MAKLSNVLGSSFDSTTVEPSAPRDDAPLPAGVYPVEITNAEVKELSKKNGHGLNLEFTVVEGPHARRKVWQLLCIVHENEQTQQIAQSQLSSLCRAVGIGALDDTDQLFQRTLQLRTKIRPAQGEYGPKAEVAGYDPMGAQVPTHAVAPAANKAGAAAPWKKKAA